MVVGSLRYDKMLQATGFKTLGDDLPLSAKIRMGLAFMLFYIVTLFFMISNV
jgi:hypothetical protein